MEIATDHKYPAGAKGRVGKEREEEDYLSPEMLHKNSEAAFASPMIRSSYISSFHRLLLPRFSRRSIIPPKSDLANQDVHYSVARLHWGEMTRSFRFVAIVHGERDPNGRGGVDQGTISLTQPSCTRNFTWDVARCFFPKTLFIKAAKVIFPKINNSRGGRCRCFSSEADAALAEAKDSVDTPEQKNVPLLKQRTEEWMELRRDRLTASRFVAALGLRGKGRMVLWEEKLGLRQAFAGNSATEWGINKESFALQRYEEMTGNVVQYLAFHVYKEGDSTQGWLGASPDGLIDRDAQGLYDKAGIVEVKCPYNKGKPTLSAPWNALPYYHMPQIQGLMEILDREWLDLFVWTLNGSAVFRVERNPEYWALIVKVLFEFWWTNVVPAKQALLSDRNADISVFRPAAQHQLTPLIACESRQLAKKAFLICRDDLGIVKRSK